MPASRLVNRTVELKEFEVVAEDGQAPFVRHLGLAAASISACRGQVSVYHMGPPLESPGEMRMDIHATAELSEDELRKIQSFIERHSGEHQARRIGKRQSYCIHPHVIEVTETDGTYSHSRFSCAGFVIEAYRYARLELLECSQIPMIDIDGLIQTYPDQARAIQNAHIRETMGLTGEGPWPVILCGYIVHALDRDPAAIRRTMYVATSTDGTFP